MTKYFVIIFAVFLLSVNISEAQKIKISPDQRLKMKELKNEVSSNFTNNIVPYWSHKMVDNINGGFYGRINANEQVFPD